MLDLTGSGSRSTTAVPPGWARQPVLDSRDSRFAILQTEALVHGKNGRRREVGMDAWGWSAYSDLGTKEQLHPWLEIRTKLPVGPLFCVLHGPTRGAPCAPALARRQLRRAAEAAGVRRRIAPHQLRHRHAIFEPGWRG